MASNRITVSKTLNNLTITPADGIPKVLSVTPVGIQGIRGNTGDGGNGGGGTGNTGATGATGATGNGISGVTLSNYNLILTFTDGTTVNAGYVRGPTGPTGASGSGGSLDVLSPSPSGYYPYASIFVDVYGRVTGASGATDIASQTSLLQIFAGLSAIEGNFISFQSGLIGGVVGGTW